MTRALTLAASVAACGLALPAAAQDPTVRIGDLTWIGASAIAHVIEAVIDGPLGSEAEIVEGLSDGSIIAAGIDKGDGSADVFPDLWLPAREAIWNAYVEDAETMAHNAPYPGTQKLYVPAYMAERVRSIEDLRDPEIAAMFDKDGNGKGEYWAGDVGWKSARMWEVKFKSYGLSELWEAENLPDATFKAQLKTAIQRERPILFYYWTPEWVHAAYDLSPIEEPARSEGCENVDLDATDWLEVSHFACASRDAEIFVGYSKSLETRNPPVAKFLSQLQLEPEMVNGWILQIGRDEMDPRDVAENWVRENKDVVDGWID